MHFTPRCKNFPRNSFSFFEFTGAPHVLNAMHLMKNSCPRTATSIPFVFRRSGQFLRKFDSFDGTSRDGTHARTHASKRHIIFVTEANAARTKREHRSIFLGDEIIYIYNNNIERVSETLGRSVITTYQTDTKKKERRK